MCVHGHFYCQVILFDLVQWVHLLHPLQLSHFSLVADEAETHEAGTKRRNIESSKDESQDQISSSR